MPDPPTEPRDRQPLLEEVALLDELASFTRRVAPRCPPNIDPHHFGTRLGAFQYLQIAREAHRLAAGSPVLDWGTGFGHVAWLLARLGSTVDAWDVTPEFEEIDDALLSSQGVRFRRGRPGEALPFEDGTFQTVISVGTLEHVDDEPAALAEIRRVVQTGGRFLIYHLPNRYSWIERIARHTGRFFHDRTYRPRECRDLLGRFGFDVEAVIPYHFLPRSSLSRVPALGSLTESRYRWVEGIDDVLARVPPLSLLVTAFTVHAVKR